MASVASVCWSQLPPVIDLDSSTADLTITGAATSNKSGWTLRAGDVNGDEEMDLVILSNGASPLGRRFVGQVDIVWGPLPADSALDLFNPPCPVSHIFGSAGDGGLYSNITCGDINNDGFDDVVFGVPCENSYLNCDGKAYVICGMADFPDTVDLDNPASFHQVASACATNTTGITLPALQS